MTVEVNVRFHASDLIVFDNYCKLEKNLSLSSTNSFVDSIPD